MKCKKNRTGKVKLAFRERD